MGRQSHKATDIRRWLSGVRVIPPFTQSPFRAAVWLLLCERRTQPMSDSAPGIGAEENRHDRSKERQRTGRRLDSTRQNSRRPRHEQLGGATEARPTPVSEAKFTLGTVTPDRNALTSIPSSVRSRPIPSASCGATSRDSTRRRLIWAQGGGWPLLPTWSSVRVGLRIVGRGRDRVFIL